jgi:hypothetical protein
MILCISMVSRMLIEIFKLEIMFRAILQQMEIRYMQKLMMVQRIQQTGATLKNNANFATAPDGTNTTFSRSRMQMFMWDGAGPVSLTYNAPAPIAGP